jgi:hypothetical protein
MTKPDQEYIRIAREHLGTAVRDNSREDLIEFGKQIDSGEWED